MAIRHLTAVARADLRQVLPVRMVHPVKSVLKVFADHANDADMSWPHVETIALEAGLARQSVSRATDAAVSAGLLIKRRTQSGNRYRINMKLLDRLYVPPKRRKDPAFPEFDSPNDGQPANQPADQPFSRNETSDKGDIPNDGQPADQPFSRNETSHVASREMGDRVTRNGRSHDATQNHQRNHHEAINNQDGGDDGSPSKNEADTGAPGGMEEARALLERVRQRCAPELRVLPSYVTAVAEQLAAGHSAADIERVLTEARSYRSPAAGVVEQVRALPDLLASRPRRQPVPPWCGQCDPAGQDSPAARLVTGADGGVLPCPRCHPRGATSPSRDDRPSPADQRQDAPASEDTRRQAMAQILAALGKHLPD